MRLVYILLIGLALASCSAKFKQKVGVTTTGPDEYQVQRNKPLEVPPQYLLDQVSTN